MSANCSASCCCRASRSADRLITASAASSGLWLSGAASGTVFRMPMARCSFAASADAASDSSSTGSCERVISTMPTPCNVRRKASASPLKSTKLYFVISVIIPLLPPLPNACFSLFSATLSTSSPRPPYSVLSCVWPRCSPESAPSRTDSPSASSFCGCSPECG